MAKDIEAYERGLIGALLVAPVKMAAAMSAGVKAAWFSDDRWSLLWSAFEGFWKRGEIEGANAINIQAEAERLAKNEKERRDASGLNVTAIQQAMDDACIGPLDASIRLLRNCAIERDVKQVLADEMPRLEEQFDYTDGVISLRGRLDAILGNAVAAKKISPGAVFEEIEAEYSEAHNMRVSAQGPRNLKWTPGYKMPWPKMTEFLNGLRAGLHVIAARPSVGKTAYTINLMRFWCETGYHVLFCSLDMPRLEVMRRFVAEKSRVSSRKAAFSPTELDMQAMREAMQVMREWPLVVVETRDVDELRTVCMIEKAAGRLDILVVDYLQLLHAKALGREDAVEYARVSYVSDTLKRLANELHIPVMALAQLNRESTKQDQKGRLPGLADLRGSGSIEQDAFTVTILHRDAPTVEKWRSGLNCDNAKRLIATPDGNPAYKYNFDDLDPIWWILCKAQNGPTGRLPFLVRKKYFCWMLGDYEAEPIKSTQGYGSTAHEVIDYSPMFERVHADWRHDALEKTLRNNFALLDGGDEVQNDED